MDGDGYGVDPPLTTTTLLWTNKHIAFREEMEMGIEKGML